jgi:hypothetical protein
MKETFREALNMVPNGVALINLDTMAIDFANKELNEMLKISCESVKNSFSEVKERLSGYIAC